jgi:hypothetical protein
VSALWLLQDLPGRDHARQLARDELAHRAYQRAKPSWFVRLMRYLIDQLNHALSTASGRVPGGGFGLLLIGLLLAGLVALVVVRLRPSGARSGSQEELFGDQVLTAAEHRRRAEQAAASGAYADAVRERLRAVVRELEARGVLDPRPGRTADEVAREAGLAVPAIAAPLAQGATVFDEVWYGGRVADKGAYQLLVDVDRTVTDARLARA